MSYKINEYGDRECCGCGNPMKRCECPQEEGTLSDCATDFVNPSLNDGIVAANDDSEQEFEDPAWCNKCNRDIAFCLCECEECGENLREEMRYGEKLCSGCEEKARV